MDDFNTGRSKSWNFYTSANPSPPPRSGGVYREEAPWSSSSKNYGTTSMNAVSFGFVATAILISMFLIMAIFEHYLFKPTTSNSISNSHQDGTPRSSQARAKRKLAPSSEVAERYSTDYSVVMPGQDYPTYIAQPAPFPCPREGACWPSHEHVTTIHLPS